jgi:CMP-N-acetylneuraminic acid synthetase
METFAFIFARGGSKGVPGKNIRPLAGKPLLAYAIDVARQVPEISRVFVSTDDADIAKVAVAFGAEVIDRPASLAQDDSPEWLAWRHAIDWLNAKGISFDTFISIPTTSPLRKAEDIISCLQKLDAETDIVVSVTPSARSPWFNMVHQTNGYVDLLIRDAKVSRRQDAPVSYDMTTVAYVTRPGFIQTNDRIFQGRVKAAIIPAERALDIDTEIDFRIAEVFISNKAIDDTK